MAIMRKDKNQAQEQPKILDVTAAMQGELTFKDPVNLRIGGNFEGKLDTKGELTIGNTAVVKANIHGDIITVSGTVEGSIVAYTSLSFTASAGFTGELTTPVLEIEKGAVVNGKCTMARKNQDVMSLEEVAQYLEVESNLLRSWAEKGKIPAKQAHGNWVFEKQQIDQWVVTQKQ